MTKRAEDFDSFNEWIRYSHGLKLCDAMWHFSIIGLVAVAMFTAGVPLMLSTAFQVYMIMVLIDSVERNHESRVKYWLSLL